MVKRGVLSLEVNDNVVLTDLAYEKANRLGMRLVRDKPDNPPGAPVRPYLAQNSAAKPDVRIRPRSFCSLHRCRASGCPPRKPTASSCTSASADAVDRPAGQPGGRRTCWT